MAVGEWAWLGWFVSFPSLVRVSWRVADRLPFCYIGLLWLSSSSASRSSNGYAPDLSTLLATSSKADLDCRFSFPSARPILHPRCQADQLSVLYLLRSTNRLRPYLDQLEELPRFLHHGERFTHLSLVRLAS